MSNEINRTLISSIREMEEIRKGLRPKRSYKTMINRVRRSLKERDDE